MKRKNTTRNALFTSIMSLLLCVSMLVGTTFAWFTDEVKSANNIIKSGNLDVTLEYWDGDSWEDVKDKSDILTGDLWEPGYVDVAYLRLKNAGSLDLKYHLGVNIISEKEGKNQLQETFKLSDYIYFDVVEGVNGETAAYATREAAMAVATETTKISAAYSKAGSLAANSDYVHLAMVVYMPTWVNNVANHNGTDIPQIDLGINVFATQYTSEEDTFDKYYDAAAGWLGAVDTAWYEADPAASEFTIYTAEELAGLARLVNNGTDTFAGQIIKLGADLDLSDKPWTPIGNDANQWNNQFNGKFNGNGHTISNLYVVGKNGLGLFGYVGDSAHIEGVTIDGAYVSGENYVGAVVGFGWLAKDCVKDCTVMNAEIIATPYLLADGVTYDGGAKAGAVAGLLYNGNISGNKAINCSVQAYRDLGGIVGMASGADWAITISKNSVDTVTLTYAGVPNGKYEGNTPNENMGDIVGRTGGNYGVTIANDNTAANMTHSTVVTYVIDEIKYEKDASTGIVTLTGVTENFTSETLNVPDGVNAFESKALNGNTTIKEVTVPASLTDFGGTPNAAGTGASGGFFYGSAVEKVTLPEGMTEIPVAAFNGAKNLKEVNIPSTVTTIGINAFAYIGLTELTVPATVESIGYGAFRGMENLTTVTIEGDAHLPGYAFRSCPNLKNVFITGDDVTFDKGQIFTNKDTGDASNITVYVANETVKERLLAANTAQNYSVVVMNLVDEEDDFTTILKNAKDGDTIYLAAGEHAVNNYNVGASAGNLTLIGEDGAKIAVATDSWSGSWKPVFGINFNNLTLKNLVISDIIFSGEVTFENCTFTNGFTGSEGNLDFTITNCTMNGRLQFSNSGDSKISVSGITVTEAEFYSKGGVEFTDCAIEGALIPWTTDTVLTNSTVGEYNCENNGENTLVVDGKYYAGNAKMLKAAAAAGATAVNLFDGEYDVYGCGGKTMTINGSKNAVLKLYNEGEDGCDYAFGGNGAGVGNVTFNGVTIDTTGNTGNYKGFAYMKGVFNDCNFVGAYSLNNANDFVFNRCTFDFKNGYFWTWGANSVTFNGCTFNGNSKNILAHGWASTVININNCTFAATEKGYTGAGDNTAAVEIDAAGTNIYTINFTGENTVTDSYAGLYRVKSADDGEHVITYPTAVDTPAALENALQNGENIALDTDLTISTKDTSSNSGYGATGVTVNNGDVFDGNGNTLTVTNANGGWDCAVNPQNGTVQNVTVAGAFRGIFMSTASGDVYIDNVVIKDVVYTFNSDGGNKDYGVYISNSELYGWTSFSNVHKEVVFTNCIFGEGSGYAFCRPYNACVFENCVFEEGFEFDTSKTSDIVFTNCYYGDTLITAENAAALGNGTTTFFYNGLNGITIQ